MSVTEGDGGGLAAVPEYPGDSPSRGENGDGQGLAAVLPMDGSQVTQDDDRLDDADPRPLWEQLWDLLRGRIERGELAGRLEAETALAQRYEVSRDTVRRALACLARDGLIRSTRGRGTFVVPPGQRGI